MATLEQRIAAAERRKKEEVELLQRLKNEKRKRDAKEAKKVEMRERKRLEDEYIRAGKFYLEKVKPWMDSQTINVTQDDGNREPRSVFQWFEQIAKPYENENDSTD